MRVPTERVSPTGAMHGEGASPETEGRSLMPPPFSITADGAATPPTDSGDDTSNGLVSQLQVGDSDHTLTSDVSTAPDRWTTFAAEFNSEFASVLHAFHPDVPAREVGVGEASGDALSAERLQSLFSENQRQMITSFFAEPHLIPDGLFNGDEPCENITAQQRLLVSAHILSEGQYRVGSVTQRVHARMCFHWIQILHHYAGATRERGPVADGIMGNFDHDGNVVFGTGETPEGFHGFSGTMVRADALPSSETSDVGPIHDGTSHAETVARAMASGDPEELTGIGRRTGMTMDSINQIQPGDWLWYYNGNGSRIGSHSVIFSHWAGPEQLAPDNSRYRRAVCFSQGHPDDGGHEHTANLGEHFFEAPNYIHPVVNWSRVSADAHPAATLDEILEVEGASRVTVNATNATHVQRVQSANHGRAVNLGAVGAAIHTEAQRFFNVLAGVPEEGSTEERPGHLSPRQRALLSDGLATGLSQAQGNELDGIQTLIRIHQRLEPIATNAALLDQNTAAASARVGERYTTAVTTFRENMTALWTAIDEKETAMTAPIGQMIEKSRTFATLTGHPEIGDLAEAVNAKQVQLQALSTEAKAETDIAQITSKVRAYFQARSERTTTMDALVNAVAARHTRDSAARTLRQEIRHLRNPIPGYRVVLRRQQAQFEDTSAALPYSMVHAPGSGGRGERNRPTTGLLSAFYSRSALARFLQEP